MLSLVCTSIFGHLCFYYVQYYGDGLPCRWHQNVAYAVFREELFQFLVDFYCLFYGLLRASDRVVILTALEKYVDVRELAVLLKRKFLKKCRAIVVVYD